VKLSERLDQEWERAASFAHWTERDPTRGPDQVEQWRNLAVTLREAAALAKRYEDAPVGECVACDFEGYERPTWHVIDDREAVPLTLRGRVRILLDTEGV
jgi:hypothetical protein